MRKTISIILMLVGIGLLSAPYISKIIMKYRVESKKTIFEEVSAEQIRKNEKLEAEYDFDSIRDIEVGSVLSGINDFDNKAIIGEIEIPDLNIDIPILKGTTNENLLIGATTMVEGQKMGERNYPLAGHYTNEKGFLFGGLIDIEKGTIVKISDKRTVYKYRIYDTLLVDETDTYIIEDKMAEEKGGPIISLMSCYYTSKNGKRFFAMGELVNTAPYNPTEDKNYPVQY